ncbi:hypothetical protein MYX06_04615 [Patescibacteria group bacterium AH-259-L05]|nr:hypothetical protein [Patescibacteria group bacterium AH-259-L05]
MAKSKEVIIKEIMAHIKSRGGKYSDWYVGIASDARARLFNDHNVNEESDAWIYREAGDSEVAREIEEYFVNTLGTDGGSGGGDHTTKFVYAYKKKSHTTE